MVQHRTCVLDHLDDLPIILDLVAYNTSVTKVATPFSVLLLSAFLVSGNSAIFFFSQRIYLSSSASDPPRAVSPRVLAAAHLLPHRGSRFP